ncbi:AAA family ATPase [Patescibacteria group bacterium]|nr:AAA family ATPase [Patescibacteria group bacterium]MBU1472353.1 AAA family ATPase [Patescibacteria group bacterium]MBU2460395.1 AAA family ATPase [Patescibacteria group bacterium]MBU2544224.1 AAA family ATPase [Patescibacteria group bacterium]
MTTDTDLIAAERDIRDSSHEIMSKLSDRVNVLRKKAGEIALPPDLETRVIGNLEEISRLEAELSARVHVEQMLNWIEWVIDLPWNQRTKDTLDLKAVREILNRNHYGLEPVKERILEYLAVLKLNSDRWRDEQKSHEAGIATAILGRRAPILCLVGLVGTGKSTLAKSIAQSMNRRFVRIPFGGMSDALELRGQSRVRPDAEIGMILKGMRYAGSKNPVILLDEIDRVAEETRGDIMGVLIELLDPEQNMAFRDHYLDYPFDLSEVLFITTANNTTNISTAVLDRLDPIQMPSYTDKEKITIGRDYVLPELMRESGLTSQNLTVADEVWPKLVRPLGFDAGIRSLERTLNNICRKTALAIVEGKGKSFQITEQNIKDFVETY